VIWTWVKAPNLEALNIARQALLDHLRPAERIYLTTYYEPKDPSFCRAYTSKYPNLGIHWGWISSATSPFISTSPYYISPLTRHHHIYDLQNSENQTHLIPMQQRRHTYFYGLRITSRGRQIGVLNAQGSSIITTRFNFTSPSLLLWPDIHSRRAFKYN
jgi:hypothetical protein